MKKIILINLLTIAFLFGLSTECQAQKAKNTKSKTSVKETVKKKTPSGGFLKNLLTDDKTPVKKQPAVTASIKANQAKTEAIAKRIADSTASAEAQKIAEAKAAEETSIKKEKEEAEKAIAKRIADSTATAEADKLAYQKLLDDHRNDKKEPVATGGTFFIQPAPGTIATGNNKTVYVRNSDAQTNSKIAAQIKALKEQGRVVQVVER